MIEHTAGLMSRGQHTKQHNEMMRVPHQIVKAQLLTTVIWRAAAPEARTARATVMLEMKVCILRRKFVAVSRRVCWLRGVDEVDAGLIPLVRAV